MKNIKIIFLILFIILTSLYVSSNAYSQDPASEIHTDPASMIPAEQQRQLPSPIERVSPGVFRIGDVMLNKKEKSISFPALVNMDKGLLEYLIVSSSGKTHESLFRTKVQPYNLQIAFLLLGFEGTDNKLAQQGSPEKPVGEPLEIMVEHKQQAETTIVNVENWMMQIIDEKKKDLEKLDWTFTGSYVMDGLFMAQSEGSIVSVFRDPTALIDNASKGDESDEIWFVKEVTVPPVGTPVTITIKAE